MLVYRIIAQCKGMSELVMRSPSWEFSARVGSLRPNKQSIFSQPRNLSEKVNMRLQGKSRVPGSCTTIHTTGTPMRGKGDSWGWQSQHGFSQTPCSWAMMGDLDLSLEGKGYQQWHDSRICFRKHILIPVRGGGLEKKEVISAQGLTHKRCTCVCSQAWESLPKKIKNPWLILKPLILT